MSQKDRIRDRIRTLLRRAALQDSLPEVADVHERQQHAPPEDIFAMLVRGLERHPSRHDRASLLQDIIHTVQEDFVEARPALKSYGTPVATEVVERSLKECARGLANYKSEWQSLLKTKPVKFFENYLEPYVRRNVASLPRDPSALEELAISGRLLIMQPGAFMLARESPPRRAETPRPDAPFDERVHWVNETLKISGEMLPVDVKTPLADSGLIVTTSREAPYSAIVKPLRLEGRDPKEIDAIVNGGIADYLKAKEADRRSWFGVAREISTGDPYTLSTICARITRYALSHAKRFRESGKLPDLTATEATVNHVRR